MLKYFRGTPIKIYLHKDLTHEYFHTQKYSQFMVQLSRPPTYVYL